MPYSSLESVIEGNKDDCLYQSAERITHRPVYRVMAGLGAPGLVPGATHDFADLNKEDVVGRPLGLRQGQAPPVLGLDPWAGHDGGLVSGGGTSFRPLVLLPCLCRHVSGRHLPGIPGRSEIRLSGSAND